MNNVNVSIEEKLNYCLKLQDQLNKKIDENWKEIRTEEDFYRAIWIECAEAVESLPWKWWKKSQPDVENLEIEIADIFHFILSLMLLKENNTPTYLYEGLVKNRKNVNIITHLENVARASLEKNYDELLLNFGIVVNNLMGFEKLYLLYVGKNILNHIRQEMGYKSGEYRKSINGIEDNRYLVKLIKEVNSIEDLERKLREQLTINNSY